MSGHSNILILEDSSKAVFGGGQKISLEVIKVLAPAHRLFLADCKGATLFKERAAPFISETVELSCYGKIVGGAKASFAVGKLELLLFPFLFLVSLWRLSVWIKRQHLDAGNTIIYATTNKTLLKAFILNRLFGIDYIFHAHSYHDRTSFYFRLILPALRASKSIIAVSEFIRKNIDLPQCVTLYNPIELQPGASPKKLDENGLVTVATFSTLLKWKGIKYFMQSYAHLTNGDRVRLLIYGTGPESEELKRFENDHVRLMGFAESPGDIMRNQVDIVAVPSIAPEACPMVPLEAFSYGIPVISTDIGGQAEMVQQGATGLQVPIENPEAIAKSIDELIDHPDQYSDMSVSCLYYAQEHDTMHYSAELLRLFEGSGR